MALPARKIYDDDTESGANSRPKFGVIDGGGESTKPKTGHLKSVGDEPEDLAKKEQGASESADSLSPDEQSESSSLNDEGEEDSPWDTDTKAPKGLRYKIRKKQAIAGSGIAGLIIGGGLGVATILGPVSQFLQFSALLERFHFSDNSSFGDNRAGKLIKWAKTRNKKQNRNLSVFGNKIADHYEKKIKAKGMTPDYDASTGRIKKITIDDIDTPEGRKAFNNLQTAGYDPVIPEGSKSAIIDLGGDSARTRRRAISAMAGALDINGVSTSVASRMLKVRGGVDFHPLKNIARNADEDFWEYVNKRKADRDKARTTGTEPDTRPKSDRKDNPDEPASDADKENARKVDEQTEELKKIASDDTINHKTKVSKIKGTLGAGVGATAIVGLVCGLDTLGEESAKLQEANIVGPLMRTGMDVIAVSSQIKSGQGVNMDELGARSLELYNKIEKTSWMGAKSILTELGKPNTGKPMPDSAKPGKEKPAFFQVIDTVTNPISGLCSALNNTFAQIGISVAGAAITFTGPAGLALNAASEAVSYILSNAFMDDLVRWLAGDAVDLANASGADFGNYANYGAFLSANNVARGMGGRALSDAERLALYNERQDIIKQQNKHKSLYARLADPKDIDSLFSKTVVQNSNFSAPQSTLATIVNTPLSSFKNLGSMFSKLSPRANASGALYDYGVDKVGFSLEESDAAENPYDNAKKVEPNLKRYNKDYGEKCLGTTIDPSNYKIKYTASPSYIDLEKNKNTCKDAKYAGYRMYVADKVTATSIMCYEGIDEESCEEIGLKNTGSMQPEKAPDSTAGSQVVGNPYESSVDIACAEGTIDLGIHTGYTSGTPVQHKLCAVTNLPSSSSESTPGSAYYVQGADGKAIINSRLSGALYAMINDAKTAGVTLTAASSFRTMAHQQALFKGDNKSVATPGSSSHQAGTAIDFTKMGSKGGSSSDCSDRKRADGNPGWDWLFKNAEKYGFKQYSYEPWHWDPGPPGTNNRCDSSQP